MNCFLRKSRYSALALVAMSAFMVSFTSQMAHAWTWANANMIPWDYDAKCDGPVRTATYTGSNSTYTGAMIDLPGRLYVPDTYTSGSSFALVLFFHGQGERFSYSGSTGTVDQHLRSSNANNLITNAINRQFFLYAPQFLSSQTAWTWPDSLRAVAMVKKAMQDFPKIDPKRIYVTSLSAGGAGSGFTMANFVDVFAAAVPICGPGNGGDQDAFYKELDAKPIWLFHARDDSSGNSVTLSRTFVYKTRSYAGKEPASFPINSSTNNRFYNDGAPRYPYYTATTGTVNATYLGSDMYPATKGTWNSPTRYTEYITGNHGIWSRVYNESWMYDWLLAQRLPQLLAPLPIGKTLLFDFGGDTFCPAKDASGATGRFWNGTSVDHLTKGPDMVGSGSNSREIFPFTVTPEGKRTSVSMELFGLFSLTHSTGTTAGSPYSNSRISNDGWLTDPQATGTSKTGIIRFKGLASSASYEVKIWACTGTTTNRETRYEINGVTRDLDVSDTTGNCYFPYATFARVTSSADGVLDVKVYRKPGTSSNYGVINTLELKATDATLMAVNDTCVLDKNSTGVDVSVLDNDNGPEGIWVVSVGTPTHGTATITGTTQVHYVPTINYSGSDRVTYTISDGAAHVTGTVNFTVNNIIPEPMLDWRQVHGLPADRSLDLATPAGDGVSNLLKYALNMAPQAGDLLKPAYPMLTGGTSGLPRIDHTGTNSVSFTFVRRNDANNPGVLYTALQSQDFVTWTPCAETPSVTAIDAIWERATYTQNVTGLAKRFLKLSVTATEEVPAAYDLTGAGLAGVNIGLGGGSSQVLQNGEWVVIGSGLGAAGTADSLHFETSDVTGNFQMVVRVKDLTGSGETPLAGVMLRESDSADSRMVYLGLTSGTNFLHGARSTANGTATASTEWGGATYPETWVCLERSGETVRLLVSNDGMTYTEVESVVLSGLAETVEAGLFCSSGSAGVNSRAIMSGYATAPLPPAPPVVPDVIVDNMDSANVIQVGTWTESTAAVGYYGTNAVHDGNALKGSKTITFNMEAPEPGSYEVYVWWVASANRASNVPVTITSASGTATVAVNQIANGGKWNLMGTYEFNETGSVMISNAGTNGYVSADAVKLVYVSP